MELHAFAKINLGLRIVGMRNDEFHDIETIFHRIALADTITIAKSATTGISCSNPGIPVDSSNLCWKAVEIFQRHVNVSAGVRIHIEKKIPVGAGLGGGSSDAAAVLRVLPTLLQLHTTESDLQKMALQLGSDVPFFLKDSSAYAEGRGELLTYFPFTLPDWIVLVYPNIHVSTPWAYHALSNKRNGTFPLRSSLKTQFSHLSFETITSLENDFEEVVFEQFPKIKEVKTTLKKIGAIHSLMSGSGSSVFGLFDNKQKADNALEHFSVSYFTHCTEPNFSLT